MWGTSTSDRSAHCWMSRLTFTLPVAVAVAVALALVLTELVYLLTRGERGYEGHVVLP